MKPEVWLEEEEGDDNTWEVLQESFKDCIIADDNVLPCALLRLCHRKGPSSDFLVRGRVKIFLTIVFLNTFNSYI
jgi:hypothetical protein